MSAHPFIAIRRAQASLLAANNKIEASTLEHVLRLTTWVWNRYDSPHTHYTLPLEDQLQTAMLAFYEFPKNVRCDPRQTKVVTRACLKVGWTQANAYRKEAHSELLTWHENIRFESRDRPDWIPNRSSHRQALVNAANRALSRGKARRGTNYDKSGKKRWIHRKTWEYRIQLLDKTVVASGFKTEKDANDARKSCLRTIISWCMPIDEYDEMPNKYPADLLRWSAYWASYKRSQDDAIIELLDAKEHFIGIPAAFWGHLSAG